MPKLPTYESSMAERGLQPSALGVESREATGRSISSAFHQIGDDIKGVADAYQQHQEQDDDRKRITQAADFAIAKQQSWENAKANGVTAKDWFENSYENDLQALSEKLAPQSQAGQDRLLEWAVNDRASTFRSVTGDQSVIDAKNSVAAIDGSAAKFANLASQNPDRVADYAGQMTSNISDLGKSHMLEAGQIGDLQLKARQRIYDSAISGIVARAESPDATPSQIEAAKALLQKDEWVANTSPGTYVAAMDSLTKAKVTQVNVQGNIAAQALGDVRNQIEITGDTIMYARGKQLIAGIQEATKNATAIKQAEETKKLDESFAAGRAALGVMVAPADALITARADFETNYKGESDPQKLGVLGAQRTAIDAAIKRRDTELKADSGKYALKYSPTVQQSYARFQQAAPQDKAAAFNQFAQTSSGFQQMVNPGKPVNVMTDDIRQEASRAIGAIRKPGGPAEAAGALGQMAHTYGNYWPQMAEQLRHEKIFSGDEGVAARLYSNPASQALGETILNASAATGAERFGMHMIPQEKAMALAIPAFGTLTGSLRNSGASGVDFANAYQTALAHAIQYTGTNDAGGVKVLAGKMIMDQFSFPSAMPTLRIGNDLHIDADRVADGAVAVQHDMPNHQLVVPPSYSGMGAKDQAFNYGRQIASTGKWYTNEDGSGALLYDEDGHNVQEIRNGKRVDVELKWDDLGKVADKQPGRAAFKGAAAILDSVTGGK